MDEASEWSRSEGVGDPSGSGKKFWWGINQEERSYGTWQGQLREQGHKV